MRAYSYKDISNWFLNKESMTHKKLQKLTYYAEAWSNALFHQPLINDTVFEAWVHGPVSPELYQDFKDYGWVEIEQKELESNIDEEVTELLESVWYTYGDKSGNELEALTHSEEPWRRARRGYAEFENSNQKIDANDMKEFYKSIYIGD